MPSRRCRASFPSSAPERASDLPEDPDDLGASARRSAPGRDGEAVGGVDVSGWKVPSRKGASHARPSAPSGPIGMCAGGPPGGWLECVSHRLAGI